MAQALEGLGAQALVAGCTEVPLVLGPSDLALPFIDAAEALAVRAVAFARG